MHGQQKITVRKRLFSLFLISVFVFMVLIARLAYVQLIAGGELAEKAKDLMEPEYSF